VHIVEEDRNVKQLVLFIAIAWPSMLRAQHDEFPRLSGSDGAIGDDRFSVVYDARTGERSAESPLNAQVLSLGLSSGTGVFTRCENFQLHGSFDFCVSHGVYTGFFGAARSINFGEVVHPGVSSDFLLDDLRYYASVLPTQSDMAHFDLVYIPVPEPSTLSLAVLGLLAFVVVPARFTARHSRRQ
jgi:hypothetical protein